ncbi:MAG: hypothetical protein JRI55_28865 [Deltaproteobacteria bacterium]|jgi:hypothetical protein|nr:hypothetical protein [Deltaproteobacteria bacterium]
MWLPDFQQGIISPTKVIGYLLSFSHRQGRAKAEFFARFGFVADAWTELADSLRRHAAGNEVVKIERSPFGTRYIVEGPLTTPDDRNPEVRAVWFVERGETVPRFVTAYPCRRVVR